MILIQEFFESNNNERLQEILHVLKQNIDNKNIDKIYLLNEVRSDIIDNIIDSQHRTKFIK